MLDHYKNCVQNFNTLFSPIALAEVKLDRINDEYVRTVDAKETSLCNIKASDLITSGSNWSKALNWRSFFGIPFIYNEKHFLAIGLETFEPHPTRGAYLVSQSFIFDFPLTDTVKNQLNKWHKSFQFSLGTNLQIEGRRLDKERFRAKSQNPTEHIKAEGWVIEKAINKYEEGINLYWRTLAFTDNHFDLMPDAEEKLVVSVIALELMFSKKKQKYLSCEDNWLRKLEKSVRNYEILIKE
jgi:hypothetical protein